MATTTPGRNEPCCPAVQKARKLCASAIRCIMAGQVARKRDRIMKKGAMSIRVLIVDVEWQHFARSGFRGQHIGAWPDGKCGQHPCASINGQYLPTRGRVINAYLACCIGNHETAT